MITSINKVREDSLNPHKKDCMFANPEDNVDVNSLKELENELDLLEEELSKPIV